MYTYSMFHGGKYLQCTPTPCFMEKNIYNVYLFRVQRIPIPCQCIPIPCKMYTYSVYNIYLFHVSGSPPLHPDSEYRPPDKLRSYMKPECLHPTTVKEKLIRHHKPWILIKAISLHWSQLSYKKCADLFVGVGQLFDLHHNNPYNPGMVCGCQRVKLGVRSYLLVPGVRVPVKAWNTS